MILPYTTKPSHVANKVVLNMIKRGSMPAGQRRFMFVVVCARWRWLDRVFKMEKKEWRQITTAQKLQIIQTVDENPNMKRIDIARMMNIPSSTLNTVRRYVCSFNVDENVINQLSKIDAVICELG
ncbi:Major centromere autoantigen B [Trichinella patagoniensis]|uniref:Major centromere autoantigen B n=1 Tax=Trichinella patagoniensis TaxID=990121 RepID=A0A0V0ZD38_9BILA|nr:Major centromere autoantigen B [Trichinella patagoniensis]